MKDYTNKKLISEWNTCFDENGKMIDSDKLSSLMENKEFRKWMFSKERFEEMASNRDDLLSAATAEKFLNKCQYLDDYWEMPDYYYSRNVS